MSKAWTFIGGILTGVASVFAAAAVAVEWEGQGGVVEEKKERLALPEGKGNDA